MDTREVERFLGKLFEEGDRFEVAYIKPDGQVARVTKIYGSPEFEDTLVDEFTRAEAAGFNVYTSVMPMDVQESGLYDRIWVDMDDPSAAWPFGADPNWGQAPWPKPTTLVKTSTETEGFRWQAIWLLDSPISEEDARRAMRRLAALAGADGSVHDPRRVLRVPGVVNAKRGQAARLIDTSTGSITLEAFELPEENLVDQLLTMPVAAPHHILGEWLLGKTEGDRSRSAYVCARFLKSCKVSWVDAAAIMKLGASRCEPVFSDHELEHALNSAYHRG